MPFAQPDNFSPSLLQSYLNTHYRVLESDLSIRVGVKNTQFDHWLNQQIASRWAFISACNPWSKPLSHLENSQRHEALIKASKPYQIFPALGEPCDQSWTPEKSLLILDISPNTAMALCARFEQHAIVFGEHEKPAQLLFNPLSQYHQNED